MEMILSMSSSQPSKQTEAKPIRPAATLLVIRDGVCGIEVLALKRSETMRFLPGYLAFPGGTLSSTDWQDAAACWTGSVVGQERPDDPVYALAAIRECAEEVGWLCALTTGDGAELLSETEQRQLLAETIGIGDLLRSRDARVDGAKLRFVGRWVTPPYMPARFDTRFFLTVLRSDAPNIRHHGAETAWVRWCAPGDLLHAVEAGEHPAVPPTIAMLRSLTQYASVEECFAKLHVPGPDAE
jgi:8-oxo-dGTP pyrophosphatase MutT (NUDIX family)